MSGPFLGDPMGNDPGRVGAKAATLSRLAGHFRVPVGFCVDVGIHERLAPALDGDAAALAELRALVASAHGELEARAKRTRPALAVRSSAIGEDSGDASFAGQHETILNVVGVDAIANAVLRCWRSASSERARAYRRERGMDGPPRVAVLVQELVDAEAAAIAFSADPVSGDRGVVVVNASWGLGESIASGAVTPDTHVVRKADLAITRREIADKRVMTVRAEQETHEVPVEDERRARPTLDDEQIRAVARLAIALEAEAGAPVDVECAFARGELHLLQARPITTLAAAPLAFPVAWADPADALLSWRREEAHFGAVRPPLSLEYVRLGPAYGIASRVRSTGLPLRIRFEPFNYWVYAATQPLVGPEELARAEKDALARRRQLARRLRRDWDERYLPLVLEHHRRMRSQDPSALSRPETAAAWVEVWRRTSDIWRIHMLVTAGAYAIMGELAQTYEELVGGRGSDALGLTQGLAMTLQRLQRDLHALAVTTRRLPEVARAIEGGVTSLDRLRGLSGGDVFERALRAFLDAHGDAGQSGEDLRSPAWSDDPSALIAELRYRLAAPLEDPDGRVARLTERADELAARAREVLRDRPDEARRFEEVLAVAREAGPLTEEHNYWIDRLTQAQLRRAVLAFGRRLVNEDVIARDEDVFFLYVPEVEEALRSPRDLRARVAEREAELAWAARLEPPEFLGKPPPAEGGPTLLPAALVDLGYKAKQDDPRVLVGAPASAGRARGPARLIHRLEDFRRMRAGDVLVCRSSNVSWIPLFTMAAAVVTDVGGALSHAAVIAREFGVPAVVGVGVALRTLREGEVIEVDGTAGTVRREAPRL